MDHAEVAAEAKQVCSDMIKLYKIIMPQGKQALKVNHAQRQHPEVPMILIWKWIHVSLRARASRKHSIPSLEYVYPDWFAAGKGPDPVAAALDKEMDSYFTAKPVEEASVAAATANA